MKKIRYGPCAQFSPRRTSSTDWHPTSTTASQTVTMLCLRSRALPASLKPSIASSSVRISAQIPRSVASRPPGTVHTNTHPRPQPATLPVRTYSSLLSRPQCIPPVYAHPRPSTTQPSLLGLRHPSLTANPNPNPSPQSQTRSFSATPSLGVKRRTYNPSRRVQKRRHGFLARKRTRGGRMVLANRRAKGKKALSW